jgi:predicted pyridoxine 5'-phosphate oxidase superfamily flavin-nucleotide-binding protein
MTSMFHDGSRALQDRFDTRRLADRIDEYLRHDTIAPNDAAFISERDMFFLATAVEDGRPNVSYKGGAPGFVHVVDERTLAFPSYNGNGMYLSAGNVLRNPAVGMLFIDFVKGHRLRLNGDASIDLEDRLITGWPEAQFVVRVRAREVFPNCPRYIHRMAPVEMSVFVPQDGCETPVPNWKRSDWARDVLAADDPARDPNATVV